MVTRGIMVGRFQPVHKGHIEVIKQALQEVDELIIGVGSSQEGYTFENPFTAEERMLMIKRALEEAGIDRSRIHIVLIPDVHDDKKWVSSVLSLSPEFSVVYSGNPWVQRLFREAGYEVRVPPPFRREEYQGMEIRDRMLKGEKWEDLVPNSVLELMQKINAVERMERISRGKLADE
jgi:nicotinamide-nucleotide adenylyltransferase